MWTRRLCRSRSSAFGEAFSATTAGNFSGNGRAAFFIPSPFALEIRCRRRQRRKTFSPLSKNFWKRSENGVSECFQKFCSRDARLAGDRLSRQRLGLRQPSAALRCRLTVEKRQRAAAVQNLAEFPT